MVYSVVVDGEIVAIRLRLKDLLDSHRPEGVLAVLLGTVRGRLEQRYRVY